MHTTHEISIDELSGRIGTSDQPALIDVCLDEDFAGDPRLIPGARRHGFAEIAALVPALVGREAVIICQKGKKLSHGAAAILRDNGVAARALTGGVVAWREAGLPMIPAEALPASRLWVIAESDAPDALVCGWLIRRFVDKDAALMVVPEPHVTDVADRFSAFLIATDFAGFLERLGLSTTRLARVAAMLDLGAPEAAGLSPVFAGLARVHASVRDRLDAAMPLFDALFAATEPEG